MIEPVAAVLAAEPAEIEPAAARDALEPTLWFLGRANDGIGLTQTGALNRAFVREVAERYPHWWAADVFGLPYREADVTPLMELDDLLRHLRLLRKHGRRIASTKVGRALQADPAELLLVLVSGLFEGDTFETACAQLTAALLVTGMRADYSDAIAERIGPSLEAEGWRLPDGRAPDVRDVSLAVAAFLRPAEAIGLLESRESRLSMSSMALREIGRTVLLAALHARVGRPG